MEKQAPIVDLIFLREFCHGNEQKMAVYIQTFMASLPAQFEELRSAVSSKQWPLVKSMAHTLKPQVSFIGLPGVLALVEKIEEDAQGDHAEQTIPDLFVELETVARKALLTLAQTLVTLSN